MLSAGLGNKFLIYQVYTVRYEKVPEVLSFYRFYQENPPQRHTPPRWFGAGGVTEIPLENTLK
jgi:hypothetical protein